MGSNPYKKQRLDLGYWWRLVPGKLNTTCVDANVYMNGDYLEDLINGQGEAYPRGRFTEASVEIRVCRLDPDENKEIAQLCAGFVSFLD